MNIPAECLNEDNSKIITIKDSGEKFYLENSKRRKIVTYILDKCIIKDAQSADFFVKIDKGMNFLVELKGKDLEHAIAQIESSIPTAKSIIEYKGDITGIVKCRQVPKAGRTVLKQREKILKNYGVKIMISSSRRRLDIEKAIFV